MAAISRMINIQMHFNEWKVLYFYLNFTEVCSQGNNWLYFRIGSHNGLAPDRGQAIIWTNADPINLRIYAVLGVDELRSVMSRPCQGHTWLTFHNGDLSTFVIERSIFWWSPCMGWYTNLDRFWECTGGALTHWGRDKMDAISQTTSSSAFSWKKMFEFRLKFQWSLFLRIQFKIFQHWFR